MSAQIDLDVQMMRDVNSCYLRLQEQARRRGAIDPESAVLEATEEWGIERVHGLWLRAQRGGEFHTHEEIGSAQGRSRDAAQRDWQAAYRATFTPEPGQPARPLFDATNMQFGNDGCLFRFDDDAEFSVEALERVVDTTEISTRRHNENIWTAMAMIVRRLVTEAGAIKKVRQRAQREAMRLAQLQLAIFRSGTGTDGK